MLLCVCIHVVCVLLGCLVTYDLCCLHVWLFGPPVFGKIGGGRCLYLSWPGFGSSLFSAVLGFGGGGACLFFGFPVVVPLAFPGTTSK